MSEDRIELQPGSYSVDPDVWERYGPLMDDLNRPNRRDFLTRLIRRPDGEATVFAWLVMWVRGWERG